MGEGLVKNGLNTAVRLTLACAAIGLALAPAAGAADLRVGVADDHPKASPEIAQRFFDTMTDVGLTETRITILWDSTRPTTIPEREAITHAVQLAATHQVHVTLSIYPDRARAITEAPRALGEFAAFVGLVARTYPQVKDFIIGNEPNKSRFWQPQYNLNRTPAACAAYEPLLAASYDALKAVDQDIRVIGVGLGPRGTDNPLAAGNLSISPVRCIRDIGRAYRASKRRRPIMDELSFHPHPNAASDKLETGYSWPNAGIPNLARIKQAMWDAFYRTAQPTFAETGMPGGPLRTLKVRLNEVGWQVAIPAGSRGAYFGRESVVTTDEGTQAAIYGNLIPLLACDPSVKSVLFFNLVDEANLDRWQSGLLRADWTRRPAYAIVKGSIAAGQTRCGGRPVRWRHEFRPVGVTSASPGARGPGRRGTPPGASSPARRRGRSSTPASSGARAPGRSRLALRSRIVRSLAHGQEPWRGAELQGQARREAGTGWSRCPAKRLRPGFYVYGGAARRRVEPRPGRRRMSAAPFRWRGGRQRRTETT